MIFFLIKVYVCITTYFVKRLTIPFLFWSEQRKFGCPLKSVTVSLYTIETNQETGNSSVVYVQIPSYFYKGKSSKLWYISTIDLYTGNFYVTCLDYLYTHVTVSVEIYCYYYKCGHRNVLSKRPVWMSIFQCLLQRSHVIDNFV